MAHSEQWWDIQVKTSRGFESIKKTRSRLVRDAYIRRADRPEVYVLECWSIGGRFDGDIYQTGERQHYA